MIAAVRRRACPVHNADMAISAPLRLEGWTLDFYRLPYAHEVTWANAIERDGLFALLTLRAGGLEGVAEGTLKQTW